MMMAADLSLRQGMITEEDRARVVRIIERAKLPAFAPTGMSPDDFLRLMAVDKKNVDGSLRLVLLRRLGDAVVTDAVDRRELDATLRGFCREV